MSIHLITGLPRNGKSYYCVTRMLDDLENSNRILYTNLPINPDYMAKLVAARMNTKTLEYLDKIEGVLTRIRIFRTFGNLRELKAFVRLNPMWWRAMKFERRKNKGEFKFYTLFNMGMLADYWNHTRANSIFYLDECYQVWNCLDASERSKEAKDKRKELQNYMRMHGHDGDDLYLITHKERDLDSFILDTLSYRIQVRNSKYWPIIPQELTDKHWWMSWLASLRWPIQFFMLRTFIGDEKVVHRTFFKKCDKRIFKCYDSHSRPNGLRDRGYDASNHKSSDLNKGYFSEIKEWFFDSLPAIIILAVLIVTVIGVFQGIFSYLNPPKKPLVSAPVAVHGRGSADSIRKIGVVDTPKHQPVVQVQYTKLKSVTPSALYFSDGQIIRKNENYVYKNQSYVVYRICRDFIVLRGGGRLFRISTSEVPTKSIH